MAKPATRISADSALHLGKGKIAAVVAELGMRIVAKDYPADTPLPVEAALAESLGIGRSVLREAIKVLAAKGMVMARPRVGTVILPRADWNIFDHDVLQWHLRVAPLKPSLLVDVLEIRRIIEPEAAFLAALHATPAQKQEVQAAYLAMVAGAEDPETAVSADIRLHRAVLLASGNVILTAFAPALTAILTAFFAISIERPEKFAGNLAAHEAVSRLILAGDAEAARSAMIDVLRYTEEDLFHRLGSGGTELSPYLRRRE